MVESYEQYQKRKSQEAASAGAKFIGAPDASQAFRPSPAPVQPTSAVKTWQAALSTTAPAASWVAKSMTTTPSLWNPVFVWAPTSTKEEKLARVQQQNNVPVTYSKPAETTPAATPWATSTLPVSWQSKYLDQVSQSIWYKDYATYQQETWQNLDSIVPLYEADTWLTGDTKRAVQRWAEVATALQNFSQAKNQSEARILAMWDNVVNWQQILQEQEKIWWLINKWVTDPAAIWAQLWMDAQRVTDLINWKVDKYVTLSDKAYTDATQWIQRSLDYQEKVYQQNKQQWMDKLRRLEEDYTRQFQQQEQQNKIADGNLSVLARMTGVGFSNRGIIGMEEVTKQWQRILAEMSTQYARSSADTASYLEQLADAYTYNHTELIDWLNKSIEQTKNWYFKAIQTIRSQFWDATQETEKQVKQAMVNFASDVEKYYKDTNDQMKANFDMAQTQYQNAVQNESIIYQRQQDTLTNYKEASFSMTPSQIMADSSLTPQQKSIAIAQQRVSATNYLSKLSNSWAPAPQDIKRLETLLANPNITPEVAVAQIVQSNPQQYTPLSKQEDYSKTTEVTDPQTGEKVTMQWNPDTRSRTPITVSTPSWVPIQDAIATAVAQCANGAQCGEFINKVGRAAGKDLWIKDSYESKVQAIQKIGEAKSLEDIDAGSIFAYPVNGSEYGHIGIVTSKNKDGSINIMDYNYNLDEKQRERTNVDYAEILNKGWSISKPFITNSTVETKTMLPWLDEIVMYNDPVSRRNMTQKDVKRIAEAKSAIMKNPNSGLSDVLMFSTGGKQVGAEQSKQFAKYDQAMQTLSTIQEQISDMETWPILWRLRELIPYDTDAQVLKTQLQWLIPTLARGVYGEVWVLTDNDIKLYAKTIPSLKWTKAVNEWVLAFTLDVLAGWYLKQLKSMAWQWYDVSGLEWIYENIKWQADSIKQQLGISWSWESTSSTQLTWDAEIEALFKK